MLSDGGVWETIAGQPTDDSELALAVARALVAAGGYDQEAVARAYAAWSSSGPFDVGATTRIALAAAAEAVRQGRSAAEAARAAANRESEANGALMPISPLGVFGHRMDREQLATFARADALLTHPHPVCQDANVVYTAALACAIASGAPAERIYREALETARHAKVSPAVIVALRQAESAPPRDYLRQAGWVLVALGNAFFQLLQAPTLEEGIVDTGRCGGNTDTNGAIAGALLGAVYGLPAIPRQWLEAILACRPEAGRAGVRHPRPRTYWAVDALTLAAQLAGVR